MSEYFLQLAILQSVQVTCILSLAFLIDLALRDRWPRIRYAMWLTALVKCLVPPVIVSPTGVFSWAQVSLQPTKAAAATSSLGWTTGLADFAAPLVAPIVVLLGAVWLLGAVALGLSWYRAWCRFQRAAKDPAQGVNYEKTRAVLDDLCTAMQISTPPSLVLTERDFGPAMVGLWRPTVIIPMTLAQSMSANQLRPLLAHELIHIKRYDSLVGSLQMLVAAIWWFHPLTWVAIQRLTSALEMQVDRRTVDETGIAPSRYASSLLNAVELLCRPSPIPGSMGLISCRMTSHRIRHVLESAPDRRKSSSTLMVASLCLLVLPGRGLSVPSEWLFTPIKCGQFSATIYPEESRVP